MTESIHSWHDIDSMSSSSSSSADSDFPDLLRLAELEQRLMQILGDRTINISPSERRLVEFQTDHGSTAGDVAMQLENDGDETSNHSDGYASASTTSSDLRENERLRADNEELLEERDRIQNQHVPDSNTIPEIVNMNHDDNSNTGSSDDDDDDDNSSTGSDTPGFRFSEDPPPVKPSSNWKERILGNVDVAALLIGFSTLVLRSQLPPL
mmetsp:Transcript_33825/g.82011  ORF Transcript_33825/g.82011 Transcript_33825/m.82011 type:complete len:210 (+) Transcript_33825:321-950(+)